MTDDWKTPWSVREPYLSILYLVDAAGDRVLPAVIVGEVHDAEREVLEKIAESVNACAGAMDALKAEMVVITAEREMWKRRAEVLRLELSAMTESRDAERLRYGQQRARCAVFMQAMADAARDGRQDWSHAWLKASDEAARSVRLEDYRSIIGGKP